MRGQVPPYGVAEGYGVKIRADGVAGVGGTEDRGEIHESAGGELGGANTERER